MCETSGESKNDARFMNTREDEARRLLQRSALPVSCSRGVRPQMTPTTSSSTRSTAFIRSSSRCPKGSVTLPRGSVESLSTMTCERARSPLAGLGSMVTRNAALRSALVRHLARLPRGTHPGRRDPRSSRAPEPPHRPEATGRVDAQEPGNGGCRSFCPAGRPVRLHCGLRR